MYRFSGTPGRPQKPPGGARRKKGGGTWRLAKACPGYTTSVQGMQCSGATIDTVPWIENEGARSDYRLQGCGTGCVRLKIGIIPSVSKAGEWLGLQPQVASGTEH